jgi:hypothetical protein
MMSSIVLSSPTNKSYKQLPSFRRSPDLGYSPITHCLGLLRRVRPVAGSWFLYSPLSCPLHGFSYILRPTASPTSVQTEQKVVRMDYETARYVFPPVGAFPTDKIPKATRIRAPPRPLRIRNRTDRLPPNTQEIMRPWNTRTTGTVEAFGLGGVARSSAAGEGAVGARGEGAGGGVLCECGCAGVFGSVTSPSPAEGRSIMTKELGEGYVHMLGPLEDAGGLDVHERRPCREKEIQPESIQRTGRVIGCSPSDVMRLMIGNRPNS